MAMDNDNIIDILDADGRANLKPKKYKRRYGNDEPAAGDISELLKMQIKALKSGGGIVKYADDPGGLDALTQKSIRFLEYVNDYNANAEQENLLTKVKNFSAGFYISHDSIFMYNNKAGIVIRPGRTCSDHSLLIDCHYSRVIDSQELI